MAKRNTKDIILFESLKLFADKGYDGVTVRDIAAEVGIKQSSLYKHYKSKQEIFDTLVDTMQSRFRDASTSFQLPNGELRETAKEYATGGNEILKRLVVRFFTFT
ncbi:TetR/AcrR family transcriptional regulator [Blautia sp. RD014234]|nr:TetR/AcrR family transcriptional regulator [Blautia parvula]